MKRSQKQFPDKDLKEEVGSPRWRRRRDARPSEIIAAALECFAAHGYAGTRIEEIARRAGVTVGTVYRYFDGKAALFEAVITQGIAPTLTRGEVLARRRGEQSDRLLRRLVLGWWRLAHRRPRAGIVRMVVAEAANFPALTRVYVREVVARAEDILARALDLGISRGEFRPHDVPATARALSHLVLFGVLYDHALLPFDERSVDATRSLEATLDIVLDGIRVRPAALRP
jgi:AcrR family transcriptional regulator